MPNIIETLSRAENLAAINTRCNNSSFARLKAFNAARRAGYAALLAKNNFENAKSVLDAALKEAARLEDDYCNADLAHNALLADIAIEAADLIDATVE